MALKNLYKLNEAPMNPHDKASKQRKIRQQNPDEVVKEEASIYAVPDSVLLNEAIEKLGKAEEMVSNIMRDVGNSKVLREYEGDLNLAVEKIRGIRSRMNHERMLAAEEEEMREYEEDKNWIGS